MARSESKSRRRRAAYKANRTNIRNIIVSKNGRNGSMV